MRVWAWGKTLTTPNEIKFVTDLGWLQEAQLSLKNRASTLFVESGKMLHKC